MVISLVLSVDGDAVNLSKNNELLYIPELVKKDKPTQHLCALYCRFT